MTPRFLFVCSWLCQKYFERTLSSILYHSKTRKIMWRKLQFSALIVSMPIAPTSPHAPAGENNETIRTHKTISRDRMQPDLFPRWDSIFRREDRGLFTIACDNDGERKAFFTPGRSTDCGPHRGIETEDRRGVIKSRCCLYTSIKYAYLRYPFFSIRAHLSEYS